MAGPWKRKQGLASAAAAASCVLLVLAAIRYSVTVSIPQDSSAARGNRGIDHATGSGDLNSSISAGVAARNLRWEPQRKPLDYAANGVAGPFFLVDHQELDLLPRILRDWEELRPQLTERMVRAGFQGPSEKSCFLWLDDCFRLAKHKPIIEGVEGILGRPLLLFGVTVWNAPPKSQQLLDIKFEGLQCPTVDVLVNSGARLIHNSHTMTRQMALKLANQMKAVRRFYGDESPLLGQRLESVAVLLLATKLDGVTVQDIDLEPGGAYTINGRLLYVTSNPTHAVQTSLLLQFVPANCNLRDQQVDSSHLALSSRPVLPPTLLASQPLTDTGKWTWDGRNDVRDGLVRDDMLGSDEQLVERREHRVLAVLPRSNLTILSQAIREAGSPGVLEIARSPLLDWITVERLAFKEAEVAFKSSPRDQLLVVVRGTLNYHHAGRGYREVKEVKGGELAYVSSSETHALTSSARAEYIRVSWEGKSGGTLTSSAARKSLSNEKQIFQMPVNGLGAVNARTVVLRAGQAYDPDNDADCDVLVVVLKGAHLQVVPFQEFLQVHEAVFIPAGEACIVWNSGVFPVTVVALQLCASLNLEDKDLEAAYRRSGKVM